MESARPGNHALLRPLKLLVGLSFADLAAFVLVAYAHVLTSDPSLVGPAELLGASLAPLAGASLAVGVVHAWLAYPAHRRPIIFVVSITLATLVAHAYVIGTPSAVTSGSVSGTAGTSFSNDKVKVSTSVNSSQLALTLQASGGNAIAAVDVTAGGVPLTGGWQGSTPSFSSPLAAGSSITGSWAYTPPGSGGQITVSYQYLSCYDNGKMFYGCIMDEIFYVPEGMGILAGQHCGTGFGAPTDCHLEHPPLAPALVAAGMAAFGQYNVVGWRLMPALMGSFSIPLLFGIAWKISGNRKLAYLSATLLALDVMFFSQSSGALLDIPEVFFALAAFFVYFAGLRVWKFDKFVLSGVLLGVAGLAKETAVFIALGFVTYVFFFEGGARRTRVYNIVKVGLVVGLVFAVGLQAYDTALAAPQYSYFTQHVGYIISYGSGLTAKYLECQGGPHSVGYWCKFPNDPGGPPILPTDWLTYYSPVAYFAVSVCPDSVNGVCQSGTYEQVAYYGVTNLLETWTTYVWIPLAAYAVYRWHRRPRDDLPAAADPETQTLQAPEGEGDVRFAGFAIILFLWSYVPYLFLLLAERVTYPFYFVPAIPAVAMGAAYWLSRSWFPRWLLYIYLAMVAFFFLVYFPDKGFLPTSLRILLGH